MKKKIAICSLIAFSLVVLILVLAYQNKIEFIVVTSNKCSKKQFYFHYEERNMYLNCIDQIKLKSNNRVYDLREALELNVLDFDDLIHMSKHKESYWDGGSITYYYNDFVIISCNRIGNDAKLTTDIIIGKNIVVSDVCN